MLTIQDLIAKLNAFWAEQGCVIHQGHDVETGAGTFNPATFFRCLGPEPYRAAYVEVSRRPSDGRYGTNPNRMQQFHQYQVVIKPSPYDIQERYLASLEAIGFDLSKHDIRFVHDDWEQPTLGAWGLGWEVWRDGMEVTQFTYFQSVAGHELRPVTSELTYGLERLAMTVQGVDSVWDLKWNDTLTYADIFHAAEVEWSRYNFDEADTQMWLRHFDDFEREAQRLVKDDLAIPAYDFVMKASHAFNLLDARGVISVTERTGYIVRLRDLSRLVADGYLKGREKLGTPLLEKEWPVHERPPVEVEAPPATFDPHETADFLLEIGSEELPATFVPIGCDNLERDLSKLLKETGLPYQKIEVHGSPRRLAAYVHGLALGKAAETVERRGPPVTANTEGFRRSLPPGTDVSERDGYLYALIEKPAVSARDLLTKALPNLIHNLAFPKQMRWGSSELSYARPLHTLIALHGDHVVPFTLDGLHSGRTTAAHAQLRRGETVTLQNATEYFDALRRAKVMVNIDERKTAILGQLEDIQNETGLQALQLAAVLPQVLHLVEWPQLTHATFDPHFLKAPPEVLISEMVHHQKYFPLANPDGSLSNTFIITADNTPTDEIRHGNVKVLSARLSDGVFLYEQDLKTPLDILNEKLKTITYRKELGTLYDKAQRVKKTVEILSQHLPSSPHALRAAELSKADLASGLVGEFPELQGVAGRRYALHQGEDSAVATAIDEQWMPRGEKAPLPHTPAGILLSLADKFDNLISCFSLGLQPTSSSDPYALRRQALAIIRILIAEKQTLPLHTILTADLEDFFINRVKTVFTDYNLAPDEIAASLSHGLTDIYDMYRRTQALHAFRQTPPFAHLLEVYKRAKGILTGENAPYDPAHLQEPAEKALAQALNTLEPEFNQALIEADYTRAYTLIADLQQPLATFFDKVRVMAEDPTLQQNRLALLNHIFGLFSKLLDFALIH
jgi:glycyl-tRNA synthetase